jgi:hypothetical protein
MQAQYRFSAHKRAMFTQALVSFVTSNTTKDLDDSVNLLGQLVTQLSEIMVECDKIAVQLVDITDQIMQLNRLMDAHWASALAVALRKVRSSHPSDIRC